MPRTQTKLDQRNQLQVKRAIVAAGARTNGTVNGDEQDLKGILRATFTVLPGTITDGTHAAKLQESDMSGTGYADVAAADVSGAFAANLTTDTPQSVDYIGSKRFVRLVVVSSGTTTGGVFSGVCVREPMTKT